MTKLTVQDLINVAQDLGAEVTPQKSFIKITAQEANRKACYIGVTKRTVTRVDFSGFEPEEHEALKLLSQEAAKELNLGAVRGQILPKTLSEDVSDESILECFRQNLATVLEEGEGFKLGARKQDEEEASVEEPDQMAADEA